MLKGHITFFLVSQLNKGKYSRSGFLNKQESANIFYLVKLRKVNSIPELSFACSLYQFRKGFHLLKYIPILTLFTTWYQPAVYIAESAISNGNAGSSADGSENTAAIVGGFALIFIAAASSVLLQVGKNTPPVSVQTAEYSGPSLSYYINKFQPASEIIKASSAPPATEGSTPLPTEPSAQEVSQPEADADQVKPEQDASPSVS